jgi:molybdate transport system substrate-binding protein
VKIGGVRSVPAGRTAGPALLVGALLLTGCGGGSTGGSAPSAAPSAAPQARTLTVLAAASLTETFNGLEKQFETDHPGVEVKLSYSGSSDLAQQIVNGSPADVFAAASDATMKTVTDAGLAAGAPKVFATNVLQIATAPGNPKGIAAFADLAEPDLKVVVCAPQVPCGAAEQKIEKATGVTLKPVSQEADVKSTLSKVTSGDADAGLVYVTDVNAAKNTVQGVNFPEAGQATTNYPIAVLRNAPQAQLAQQFEDVVTGEAGQKALQAAGFGPRK